MRLADICVWLFHPTTALNPAFVHGNETILGTDVGRLLEIGCGD